MKQKKHLIKLIIAIVIIYLPTICSAQWEHIYTYDKQIYALDAVTPDTVYVVGLRCAIKTLDGGETWNDINYNCEEFSFRDVEFPTPQLGYIIGINGIILKSSDYGNSWQEIGTDTITRFVEAEFISPDTGWIIGNYSEHGEVIMRTYNGGTSWDYFYPDVFMLTDIQMLNSNIGYITHWEGILKTFDGGNSWLHLSSEFNGPPTCCSFVNPDTGFIGAAGLYKTENGGADWIFLTYQHWIGYLYRGQLQFINTDTGYYSGYDPVIGDGVLCVTKDGGYDWELLTTGKYYDIEMYDNNIGYNIKFTGEIYKTTNGGLVNTPELREFLKEQLVNIYPNPFIDKLYIDLKELPAFLTTKHVEIQVVDIVGKIVFQKSFQCTGFYSVPLGILKQGIYYYTLLTDNNIVQTGKILKTGK